MIFQNPLFLFGLTSLLLPVLFHLMERMLPRRHEFPTIRFIRKAHNPQRGKRSLRDLITLLLRLIMLSSIVLLFASPVLMEKIPLVDKKSREVVLFYDLSASMNVPGIKNYFLEQTKKVLHQENNATFAFLASSNHLVQSLPFSSTSEDIILAVKKMEVSLFPGNHQEALHVLQSLFHDNREKVMYIFSDLQRYDWSPSGLPSLNLDAKIHIIKPEHSNQGNVAIQDVKGERYSKEERQILRAFVHLQNFSPLPAQGELKLISGKKVVMRTVTLRPNQRETAILDLDNPSVNIARIDFINGEPYTIDNHYHHWIGPKLAVKIAVMVDEDRSKSLETFFLHNALSVSLPGNDVYNTQFISPEYIWDHPLDPFQCLFILDSIWQYSEEEMNILKKYVTEGGSIIYFSGKKTPETMMKFLKSGLSSTRFIGYQGEGKKTYHIETMQGSSPIMSPFQEEKSDLFLFPIYRFVTLLPGSTSESLLLIEGEQPFLIHERLEKGELFLFSSNLTTKWSEFPTSFSFLPLIRHIIEYTLGTKRKGILNYTIGSNSQTLPGVKNTSDLIPGVKIIEGIPIEINVSRAESDLHSVEDFEVFHRLQPKQYVHGYEKKGTTFSTYKKYPLEKYLAWLLISAILLEMLVANRKQKAHSYS